MVDKHRWVAPREPPAMSHAKSFPRRRESSAQVVPAQAGIQWSAHDDWVPACAGMTIEWCSHRLQLCWVPACAGMTDKWEANS